MKRKLLRVLIFIGAAALYVLPVCAKGIEHLEQYDYPNHKAVISGTVAKPDGFVMITVLDKDKAPDFAAYEKSEDKDGCVLFRDQVEVKDGKFSVTVGYNPGDSSNFSGNYKTALVSTGAEERTEFDLALVNSEDMKNAYKAVNAAAQQGDLKKFAEAINQNKFKLGFDFDLVKDGIPENYLSNYLEYVKKNELTEANSDYNTRLFKTYIVSSFANNNKLTSIGSYLGDMYFDDEAFAEDYKTYCADNNAEQYFIGKFSGRNISDYDSFKKAFAAAVVLSGTKYSDGSDTVRNLAGRYASLLGIPTGGSNQAYAKMQGEDFADISAFNAQLQKNIAASSDKNSGSGGGGGGLSLGGNLAYSADVNTEMIKPAEIQMTFEDLDGVLWASEAILALADKGIVNGVGERKFAPDENVIREEFVKILICAMGIQTASYTPGVFVDVPSDEWFAPYVYVAYEKGLIKGIGDGRFGTGDSITREDMVTMLYQALKISGAEVNITSVNFDDFDEISYYARDAVSALYNLGAVNGMTETTFEPKGLATRAQAAKVIYGILEQLHI